MISIFHTDVVQSQIHHIQLCTSVQYRIAQ